MSADGTGKALKLNIQGIYDDLLLFKEPAIRTAKTIRTDPYLPVRSQNPSLWLPVRPEGKAPGRKVSEPVEILLLGPASLGAIGQAKSQRHAKPKTNVRLNKRQASQRQASHQHD